MKTIRLGVIDDHRIVRDGIKAILLGKKNIKLVFESENGKSLLEFLKENSLDLILLDLSLPDVHGMELVSPVISACPDIKIVILTASMDEESICESVKLGAHGFLHKDTSSEELIKAIELVCEGEPYFGQRISNIIYKSYTHKLKESNKLNEKPSLSEREKEIVTLLSEGLSFKEIADKLFISPRTVENHRNNILQKLELRNTIEVLRYALKNKIIEL
jgi:DNA-binding NarL/FixJ family response regulator